ncbi:MAG: hypothetical protein ACP5SI_03220 [Chloroflexia bacterium]
MKRKRFAFLACIAVMLPLVLMACGPTQTPAPGGATPAPATGRLCEGVRIVFFPGGPPG